MSLAPVSSFCGAPTAFLPCSYPGRFIAPSIVPDTRHKLHLPSSAVPDGGNPEPAVQPVSIRAHVWTHDLDNRGGRGRGGGLVESGCSHHGFFWLTDVW